jgi:hypothetical protein
MASFMGFLFIFVVCFLFVTLICPHTFADRGRRAAMFITIGSFISFVSCLYVITSYIRKVSRRRHPSPVIFFRTLVNFIYATTMICSNVGALFNENTPTLDCSSSLGKFVSTLVEFSIITSEGWFVVLILDLLTTLTNPFADYRVNMLRYHLAVWSLGVASFIGQAPGSSLQPQLMVRAQASGASPRVRVKWRTASAGSRCRSTGSTSASGEQSSSLITLLLTPGCRLRVLARQVPLPWVVDRILRLCRGAECVCTALSPRCWEQHH